MTATETRTIKIVLADDHNLVRESLADSLGRQGDMEIVGQASDGLEALELARRIHPDVVVMDVSMPNMSGLHATQRMTIEMPGVRIVGLSMHASQEMARAMRSAGAAAYLSKEASVSALIGVVRALAPPEPA